MAYFLILAGALLFFEAEELPHLVAKVQILDEFSQSYPFKLVKKKLEGARVPDLPSSDVHVELEGQDQDPH